MTILSTIKTHQWGGAAFMLGNVLFLVNKLNEMSRLFLSRPMDDVISGQDGWLLVLGQIPLVIGYLAYYQCYAPRVGRLSRLALSLFVGGGLLVALGHLSFISDAGQFEFLESMFIFVLLGLTLLLVGLIGFGLANLRQPVLGRWQWLPVATGLMGFIGFFLFGGAQITAIFLFFRTLFALGLMGLGLTLCLNKPSHLVTAP
jgi:hypothetical protein